VQTYGLKQLKKKGYLKAIFEARNGAAGALFEEVECMSDITHLTYSTPIKGACEPGPTSIPGILGNQDRCEQGPKSDGSHPACFKQALLKRGGPPGPPSLGLFNKRQRRTGDVPGAIYTAYNTSHKR